MKKIRLYKEGVKEFTIYINTCLSSEIIFEMADNNPFKELLNFHLNSIKKKLGKLDAPLIARKSALITFDLAEIIVLSYMFKRLPLSSYMEGIKYSLIGQFR